MRAFFVYIISAVRAPPFLSLIHPPVKEKPPIKNGHLPPLRAYAARATARDIPISSDFARDLGYIQVMQSLWHGLDIPGSREKDGFQSPPSLLMGGEYDGYV